MVGEVGSSSPRESFSLERHADLDWLASHGAKLGSWLVLERTEALKLQSGLCARYPARMLAPIARRQDNDDVLCWDLSSGRVQVIHDFASPGWELLAEYADVRDWLADELATDQPQ